MTYKILHGMCPENLVHKFVEKSMISEYETRYLCDLKILRAMLCNEKFRFLWCQFFKKEFIISLLNLRGPHTISFYMICLLFILYFDIALNLAGRLCVSKYLSK